MPERKRCFSADVFPKLTIKSCHCHHRHHGWRLETGNRFDRCLLLTTRIDHNPFQAASDIYKNIFGNLYHGLAVSFFRRHSGTSAPLRAVIITSPIVKVNNHCKQCQFPTTSLSPASKWVLVTVALAIRFEGTRRFNLFDLFTRNTRAQQMMMIMMMLIISREVNGTAERAISLGYKSCFFLVPKSIWQIVHPANWR